MKKVRLVGLPLIALSCVRGFDVQNKQKALDHPIVQQVISGERHIEGNLSFQLDSESNVSIGPSKFIRLLKDLRDIDDISRWVDDQSRNILSWITEEIQSVKNLNVLFSYVISEMELQLVEEPLCEYLERTKDKRGRTTMHIAAEKNSTFVFEQLLNRSSHSIVVSKDEGGNTPALHAITAGNEAMLDKILEVRPQVVNEVIMIGGATPMCIAALLGRINMIKKLASTADLNVGNANGNPLMIAILRGLPRAAEVLIDRGADVSIHHLGEPSIIWAAAIKEVEIVKVLLAEGARPSGRKIRKVKKAGKIIMRTVAMSADTAVIAVGVPGNTGIAKSIFDQVTNKNKPMTTEEKLSARKVINEVKDRCLWILKVKESEDTVRYGSYYRKKIIDKINEFDCNQSESQFRAFIDESLILDIHDNMNSQSISNKIKKELKKRFSGSTEYELLPEEVEDKSAYNEKIKDLIKDDNELLRVEGIIVEALEKLEEYMNRRQQ